jgi:carbonic anhydrase
MQKQHVGVVDMSSAGIKKDSAEVLGALSHSVSQFENNFPLQQFAAVNYQQHPAVTLLTCSDARMPADIFGHLFNNIFCIENIGNQYKTSAGSVLYGLLHLHTPLVVIAGHTDCGAIKAAGSDYAAEPAEIRNELSIVRNSLDDIAGIAGSMDTTPLDFSALAELNIDMQINYMLADGHIAQLAANQSLLLMGVMVDLHNVHKEGYGKVYITNVNGEHKCEVLKTGANLGALAQKARRLVNY